LAVMLKKQPYKMRIDKKILFGRFLIITIFTMNIFNLFGQNKQQNDPYWEFDKTKHFRPKLNKSDFFKLTGFDFGWLVLEPISEFIQDRKGELTKGNTLSYGQKTLYYWWYVDAQVTNGGFTQFYYNDYGMYVPTIIKGLKHIGDNKMAELVNRSYELYLKENKKIKDARKGGLEAFSNLYKEITDFDELDDEYYKLNEQTMKNIENYIRKNLNEFCLDENGNEFDMSFVGELKTFYSPNKPKEVIQLSNGVVSGTYKSYFENGNPKEIIEYINGEQTGERNEYYENGNKKYSVKKLSDKKQFEHFWYHENGNPKKLEHKLLDKDERIGEYKEWYENGQLEKTGTYVSNYERNGQWIEYHKDGSKRIEAEFKNDNFLIHNCWNKKGEQILTDGTGLYINEYSIFDGIIDRNEQEYKNYKRHGKQYSYSNGKLTLYQEMFEGKEHGVTKSYDDNGNLEEESIYENGKEISRKKIK
ncbi:MAG: DMP19 family protein, partial [Bacteroidia bacterium]